MTKEFASINATTPRKLLQAAGRDFKKGAYGAFMRLVIEDLQRHPPDGPGPNWKTWQPWAIKQLKRGLAMADAAVDIASNNATKAAHQRKTSTSNETRESLLKRREAFFKKHGKHRGWKSSVAIDLGISGDAMTDLCRRHGIDG